MILLYCPKASEGVVALYKKLKSNGLEVKRLKSPVWEKGDLVVCWGFNVPQHLMKEGVTFLNPTAAINKLAQLKKLGEGGVKTVEFSTTPMGEGWLGRSATHHEGLDLLHPPPNPAYWVKKLVVKEEYRVHVWRNGDEFVSVRAGTKIPREGVETPHPWVRSWSGGWRLSYGNPNHPLPPGVRQTARVAVKTLGLDFGAVDLGLVAGGGVVVFEVNSRPGLEGGTVDRYAAQISTAHAKLAGGGPVGAAPASVEGDGGTVAVPQPPQPLHSCPFCKCVHD